MNLTCFLEAMRYYTKSEMDKCALLCPAECEYEKFSINSITSLPYPSKLDFDELIADKNISLNYNETRQILLKLNFYFENMQTTIMSETAKVSGFDILGSIGGILR